MNFLVISAFVACIVCAGITSIDVVFGETGGHSMSFIWKLNHPNLCSGCYLVEPNDNYLGHYQVHILQPGEKPTFYNYNCWGCDISDYQKILDETGLWYYPQGHP